MIRKVLQRTGAASRLQLRQESKQGSLNGAHNAVAFWRQRNLTGRATLHAKQYYRTVQHTASTALHASTIHAGQPSQSWHPAAAQAMPRMQLLVYLPSAACFCGLQSSRTDGTKQGKLNVEALRQKESPQNDKRGFRRGVPGVRGLPCRSSPTARGNKAHRTCNNHKALNV